MWFLFVVNFGAFSGALRGPVWGENTRKRMFPELLGPPKRLDFGFFSGPISPIAMAKSLPWGQKAGQKLKNEMQLID